MSGQSSDGLWSQWWRLGGILGIGGVLFIFLGFAVQGMTPETDDSMEEIRSYFNESGAHYMAGDYLHATGFAFLLFPFVLSLRALLSRAEGGTSICSWLGFAGGLSMFAVAVAAGLPYGALAMGAAAQTEVSDSAVRALMYMYAYGMSGLYLTGALMVLPFSVVIFRTSVLWRWLAFFGGATGIMGIVGAAWVIGGDPKGIVNGVGLISFFALLFWILLVSANMLLKREL